MTISQDFAAHVDSLTAAAVERDKQIHQNTLHTEALFLNQLEEARKREALEARIAALEAGTEPPPEPDPEPWPDPDPEPTPDPEPVPDGTLPVQFPAYGFDGDKWPLYNDAPGQFAYLKSTWPVLESLGFPTPNTVDTPYRDGDESGLVADSQNVFKAADSGRTISGKILTGAYFKGANDMTFERCIFRPGRGWDQVIYGYYNTRNITFRNCWFDGATNLGVGSGKYLTGIVAGLRVENCVGMMHGGDCIDLHDGTVITGNYLHTIRAGTDPYKTADSHSDVLQSGGASLGWWYRISGNALLGLNAKQGGGMNSVFQQRELHQNGVEWRATHNAEFTYNFVGGAIAGPVRITGTNTNLSGNVFGPLSWQQFNGGFISGSHGDPCSSFATEPNLRAETGEVVPLPY